MNTTALGYESYPPEMIAEAKKNHIDIFDISCEETNQISASSQPQTMQQMEPQIYQQQSYQTYTSENSCMANPTYYHIDSQPQQQPQSKKKLEKEFSESQKIHLFNKLKQSLITYSPQLKRELPDIEKCILPTQIIDLCSSIIKHIGGSMLQVYITILGITSIACRGNFEVKRTKEHIELLTLYLLISINSGSRKTPIQKLLVSPIQEFQKSESTRLQEKIQKSKICSQLIEKEIKKFIRKGYTEENIAKIAELTKQLPPPIHQPNYFTTKGTMEGIGEELERQGGAFGILSSELGFLKDIQNKKDDLLLMAWDGEQYQKTNAETTNYIESPCLSILINAQPEPIKLFTTNKHFQGDGLLGRFQIIEPSNIATPLAIDDMPLEPLHRWKKKIDEILSVPRKPKRYQLELEPVALDAWNHHYRKIDNFLLQKKMPPVIQGYYGKLAGSTLRIAGLIHLIEENSLYENKISLESMNKAIQLSEILAKHTTSVLDTKTDHNNKLLSKIIKILAECNSYEYPVRSLYRQLRIRVGELLPFLEFLEKKNVLRIHNFKEKKTCIIHPNLATHYTNTLRHM